MVALVHRAAAAAAPASPVASCCWVWGGGWDKAWAALKTWSFPGLGTAETWWVEGNPFFHLKVPDGPSGPIHEAPLGHGWLILRGTPCYNWSAALTALILS